MPDPTKITELVTEVTKFRSRLTNPSDPDRGYLGRPTGTDRDRYFTATGIQAEVPDICLEHYLKGDGVTDDSAVLQAIMNSIQASGRGARLIAGKYQTYLVGDIKVPSGVIIEGCFGACAFDTTPPQARFKQKPGSAVIFGNWHWTSPWDGAQIVPNLYSRIVDENITLRSVFLDGNHGLGGAGNVVTGFGVIAAWGVPATLLPSGLPLMMLGVRNLVLEDVAIYDPAYFHTLLSYIDGFRAHHVSIRGGVSESIPNTDGLHFEGNCRDGDIDGISGFATDDFIALNGDELDQPGTNISKAWTTSGPITNFNVSNIRCNAFGAVRLIGGWSYFDEITIKDVRAIVQSQQAGILVGGTVTGVLPVEYGRISISDIFLEVQAANAVAGLKFSGRIQRLHLSKVMLNNTESIVGSAPFGSGGIVLGDDPTHFINDLEIDKFSIQDVALRTVPPISVAKGTIDSMRISDSYAAAPATQDTGAFLNIAAGTTVKSVQLLGAHVDRINNVVKCNENVTNITTSNMVHLNAGGNESIAVAVGKTLARLRSGASNTAALVGGSVGRVTSKKTDGTEDAT